MITLSIPDLPALQREFDYLGRNLNRAIAAGINRTAAQVVEAEKAGLKTHLDRPTPFTLNSLGLYRAGANHPNPSALVYVKPIAAAYLETTIAGGEYEGLHPGKIRLLPASGNIPKRKGSPVGMSRLITNKRQFVGKIKTRRGQEIFGLFERGRYQKVPKPWTRQRPARVRPVKPYKILVFSATSRRTAIMPYYAIAAREVERNLGLDVRQEVDRLLEALYPGARRG